MDVRYKDRPESRGQSNRFNPAAASEVVVVLDEGGKTSELIRSLEVRLSDGRWRAMADAFRDGYLMTAGDDGTAFFEHRTKQVAIPAVTVGASLRDVQAAAAQLTGHSGWPYGGTSVENTSTGIVVRGRWWDPATSAPGAWRATYEVQEAQSGGSMLSGTVATKSASLYGSPRSSLEEAAWMHINILAANAERVAREHSAELDRSPAGGPARAHMEPGNSRVTFAEDRAAWVRSAESRARRLGATGLEH